MWPFKKKDSNPDLDVAKDEATPGVEAFRKFRPIGGEFNYLGRRCVVTAHYDYSPSAFGPYMYPCLKADYADDHGVIQRIQFLYSELPALLAQNTPAWE